MLSEEQKKKLNEPLPKSWIATRDQSGQTLSYVEGWRIIDRLNAIFGAGCWSYDCEPKCVAEGVDAKEQHRITYIAKCTLRVGEATIGDCGAGHGIAKDLGSAHESAIKEACTDALKRSAKSLGMSLGLALYDKKQARVAAPQTEVIACRHSLDHATTPEMLKEARGRFKDLLGRMTEEDEAALKEAGEKARARVEGDKR